MFRTPNPKQFKYKPRYYNEEEERLEQRKAELGYETRLSRNESLRFQMSKRWRKGAKDTDKNSISKFIYYFFFTAVILGGIYLIFFTGFVNELVALFGVGK